MGLNKFRDKIFGDNEDEEVENTQEILVKPTASTKASTIDSNKMIIVEPRAFSECQQIAKYLLNNNPVIFNLKRVTPDQAKRIVDFISGTVFAINGGLQKISPGTFLCTPNTVAIEGRITEEKESKKVEKPKAEKDEVEMDW